MARDLPPEFVDERELTTEERQCLNELLPPEKQTGDTRADLVAATHVMVMHMRQHELDMLNVGAVFNALYRDVRSWRRIQAMTGIPFTSARQWVARWRAEEASGTDAVV